jgi:RNA polymerase sigma factor (sigma-70 family)
MASAQDSETDTDPDPDTDSTADRSVAAPGWRALQVAADLAEHQDGVARSSAQRVSLWLYRGCQPPCDAAVLNALLAYLARVARAVLRDALAADRVAQETLDMLVRRAQFVSRPEAFLAYCQVSAKRAAIRLAQANMRQLARELSLDEESDSPSEAGALSDRIADPAPSPLECVADAEARRSFWQCVARAQPLTPRERSVLVLRFCDGLRPGEIASSMAISRNSVDSACAKALAKLRRDAVFVDKLRLLGYD